VVSAKPSRACLLEEHDASPAFVAQLQRIPAIERPDRPENPVAPEIRGSARA